MFALALSSISRPADRNEAKAVGWLQLAAKLGHTESQVVLGKIYQRGLLGVPASIPDAIAMYKRSADEGSIQAVYKLARLYQHTGDYESATTLYRHAVKHHHPKATCALALMYSTGLAVELNVYMAFVLYSRAADLDFVPALLKCGVLLEAGLGCTRDMEEALRRYEQAARFGNADARVAVERLCEELDRPDADIHEETPMKSSAVPGGVVERVKFFWRVLMT
eukprot:TRINITY_DN8769_c0_g1_i1.p1 TRINITY_DN8769_c0_g1~~TRINITY_DN8769_c0_g1_i1.p1  ORF type:complete len:223 (+),score=42.86 TRINITY_DN8769_c0_g1_i1:339-1007(+)